MAESFKLPDGRVVDYLVSGDTAGFPLIWIHGTPSSYVGYKDMQEVCGRKGIKLITFSRAGYGGSSRHAGRNVVDAVPDVQALADHLNVKRCLVAGWSGGGKLTRALCLRYVVSSSFY